jgi:hypothetical protein
VRAAWRAALGILEILGGLRAPARRPLAAGIVLGLWWSFLFLVVLATMGGATKFIYVDF